MTGRWDQSGGGEEGKWVPQRGLSRYLGNPPTDSRPGHGLSAYNAAEQFRMELVFLLYHLPVLSGAFQNCQAAFDYEAVVLLFMRDVLSSLCPTPFPLYPGSYYLSLFV